MFGKKKLNEYAKDNTKQGQSSFLNQLMDSINCLEKAMPYSTSGSQVGEIVEQIQDTTECSQLPTENSEKFKEALEQLNSLVAKVNDQSLKDILGRYIDALTRKYHVWFWQQNFPEASVLDKERIWADLEEADKEAVILKECLSEKIEELAQG